MDFETCGSDLAQITHLDRDPPGLGRHHPSPRSRRRQGSPLRHHSDSWRFRLPLRTLRNRHTPPTRHAHPTQNSRQSGGSSLEYLPTDGTWQPGFDPSHAKEVMENGSTELSIRYHPELKQWLAGHARNPVASLTRCSCVSAGGLTGPWTQGQVIYHIPEMLPDTPRDKNTFCYAGKEHPELEN